MVLDPARRSPNAVRTWEFVLSRRPRQCSYNPENISSASIGILIRVKEFVIAAMAHTKSIPAPVFGEAVRRRLRSDSPILAELSGGMDSSSIVCMADALIAQGDAGTPRLDTISYYDDSEPNWNERPYFAKVEAKRGRTGIHIDVGKRQPFAFETDNDHFAATPSTGRDRRSEASRQFAACMTSQGYRVLLSGSGGDEVTGGVPTPVPELADLLARGHFRTLAHQLKVWALNKRKPWFHLFFSAATGFFPQALIRAPKHKRPAAWLNADFVKRNRAALHGYPIRTVMAVTVTTIHAASQGVHKEPVVDPLPVLTRAIHDMRRDRRARFY